MLTKLPERQLGHVEPSVDAFLHSNLRGCIKKRKTSTRESKLPSQTSKVSPNWLSLYYGNSLMVKPSSVDARVAGSSTQICVGASKKGRPCGPNCFLFAFCSSTITHVQGESQLFVHPSCMSKVSPNCLSPYISSITHVE
jgi:hypothetical protein